MLASLEVLMTPLAALAHRVGERECPVPTAALLLRSAPLVCAFLLFIQPVCAEESPDLWTFKTSYLTQPKTPTRLTDFITDEDAPRAVSFVTTSTLLSGRFRYEGELAYNTPAPNMREGRGDPKHRMIRLGLTGGQGQFRYGLMYRHAGLGFLIGPDQAVREVWAEWQWGIARLKTILSEAWNNVDRNPSLARLTQRQERVTLTIAPSSWMEAVLSYGRTSSASSDEPKDSASQRNQTDNLEGTLSFTRAVWNAKFSSTYAVSADQLCPGVGTTTRAVALSGSYRPLQALTIAPTLSLREERQRWSGVSTNTPSAALALTYAPSSSYKLATTGTYSKTRSSDNLVDGSTFTATGAFAWTPELSEDLRTTLSLEAKFTDVLDAIHPASSKEDVSGMIRLQLASF
jgi:hypothetical protein